MFLKILDQMLGEDVHTFHHIACYKLLESHYSVFPKSWGQVFKDCEFKQLSLAWDLDFISMTGGFKMIQRPGHF